MPAYGSENNGKRNLIFLHIGVWIIYIAYIYAANHVSNPDIPLVLVLCHVLPFCLAFYCNLYAFSFFKKIGVFAGIVLLVAIFVALLSFGYFYIYKILPLVGITLYTSTRVIDYVERAFSGYLQHFVYALLYFVVRSSFRKERSLRFLQAEKFMLEQQELKSQQEKLQLEYAFLRSQINPHFLHNTLNVLFSQALMHSDELANNIMKLSHLMRYAMESFEAEEGKVSIRNELQHLQTLIDIHQVRFSGTLHIHYTVSGETDNHMLPPLSFITVVENAFKYGDLKDATQPLVIQVAMQKDLVYFYCHNKKKAIPSIELPSHNIGLSNLRKRLDLSFKDGYEVHAHNGADAYTFELTIKK